jgi:rSAM/selenodomain-associated transferase 2
MNGISYSLLPELCDVDYPKDLVLLKNRGLADDILFPEISVIIPALNEEKSIAETIEAASGDSIQIIVADGGSSDNTARIASDSHALVVQSGRGRGIQQNEGAKYAMGEILLFLHADTLLPKGYSGEIKSALLSANYRAGAFLFSVDSARWIFKLVSFLTNLRSTLLHFPYGDQALFFHRDLFFLTGGFPKIPVMEDYVLVKKIRRSVPVYISRLKVVTSARRWQKLGVARTFIINQLMILGYHLGIPAEKLDRFYRTRKQ